MYYFDFNFAFTTDEAQALLNIAVREYPDYDFFDFEEQIKAAIEYLVMREVRENGN